MKRALLALALTSVAAVAQEDRALVGHGGPIMDVTVAEDGRIATASFDNSVGLWQEGRPRWFEAHRAAANEVIFLSDGRLASGGDDFAVVLWNSETGAGTMRAGHLGKVMALSASPDGRTLASASWDGRIGLWPLQGVGAPRFLEGHSSSVNDVAFAPDGTLYSASADGTVRAWDVADGSETHLIARHGFGVNRLALGPGWLAYGAVDGGTRLVSPLTGELLADFTAERRPILALAHSPRTGLLAVGDGEGFIMVVDLATRQVAHDFRATQRGPVWSLDFSPDGTRIYAAGLDPSVHSWDIGSLDGAKPAGEGATPYLADPASMTNGERQFQRKCSICHSLQGETARKAGPTLEGIFGRTAGMVPDYIYSARLSRKDIVWTAETIDTLFDLGPDHYVPGSKMPMQRIAGENDRTDLIEFLKTATAPGGDGR